jgi:hypothetical protein
MPRTSSSTRLPDALPGEDRYAVGLGGPPAASLARMGIALCAVSTALTSRRTVDLCRVGSCLCRLR